jgi:hypothetical protein
MVMSETGDGAKIVQAFREHRPYLVDLAFRMLGDIGAAEDAVQDAFTRLLAADIGLLAEGVPVRALHGPGTGSRSCPAFPPCPRRAGAWASGDPRQGYRGRSAIPKTTSVRSVVTPAARSPDSRRSRTLSRCSRLSASTVPR